MMCSSSYEKEAAALVGRLVRFAHQAPAEVAGRVTCAHRGMVEIEGWSGLFSPHVLVAVDPDDPRARK